jgi:hypothetical protein
MEILSIDCRLRILNLIVQGTVLSGKEMSLPGYRDMKSLTPDSVQ